MRNSDVLGVQEVAEIDNLAQQIDIVRQRLQKTQDNLDTITIESNAPARVERWGNAYAGSTPSNQERVKWLLLCFMLAVALSGAAGLLVGAPLSWMLRTIAIAPTFVVLGVALGVFIGGGILRRLKRGRPDTWLYRQLQWRIATRHPLMAGWVGGHVLISRSGFWSTRRSMR